MPARHRQGLRFNARPVLGGKKGRDPQNKPATGVEENICKSYLVTGTYTSKLIEFHTKASTDSKVGNGLSCFSKDHLKTSKHDCSFSINSH